MRRSKSSSCTTSDRVNELTPPSTSSCFPSKIRISLGLKPIVEDATPVKDADSIAADNYAQRREQEAKDRDTASLQTRIDRSLNARERQKKLVGVGLGADEQEGVKVEGGSTEENDTKAWVRKQKKNAKLLAAKREKEQAEADKRDQEAGLAKYGEEDLRGLKVAHGEQDFEEGEETILTLKDSRVLDDEGTLGSPLPLSN
jgi:U4/U6.U5 tri-snRNP-associated protein 1